MKDNSNIDNILDRYYQDRTLDVLSVDTELFRLASLIGCEPEDEERHRKQLKDYIQQELLKARIDELKRLKTIDAFNEPYSTDHRPAKLVDIRIADLQNQIQAS